MKTTKLLMWTSWGYCMTPQVFESKKKAVENGKWMRDNGYIFRFKAMEV